MKLLLRRKYIKPDYVIGDLYIDGKWFCNTVEDRDRGLTQDMPLSEIMKIKVKHETAIPYGTYKVVLSYSPKFKRILPAVLNVPGFDGIRIHNGRDKNSSSGCLIVGKNTIKGGVTSSKEYLEKLIDILKTANTIKIKITK